MRVALASIVLSLAAGGCCEPKIERGPPWTDGPTLPTARIEAGVTAIGDQLVVIGGFVDGSGITDEVDLLNTAAPDAAWDATSIPPFPELWTHFQVASIGTRIFVLGGLSGGLTGNDYIAEGDSFVFDTAEPDPAKRVWVPLAPLPAGLERGSAAVVVVPPRIFLLGGAASSSPDPRAGALASNLIYDTDTDTWEQTLPDLPAPRSHPAAARFPDGSIIVAGGLATLFSIDAASDTWRLDVPLTTEPVDWKTVTSMPDARGGCAYGLLGGRLVCAGGESVCSGQVSCALHGALAYDPRLDTPGSKSPPWCRLADVPADRAGAPGAVVGQRLFVPAGADAIDLSRATDTLFVYAAADDPALEPIPDTEHDTKLCPM